MPAFAIKFTPRISDLAVEIRHETERAYLDRAEQILHRHLNETGRDWSTNPGAFCDWFIALRAQWAPRTWRFYKAAMLCWLRRNGSAEMVARIECIGPGDVCVKKSTKTSATKMKRFPGEMIQQLYGQLNHTMKYDRLLGLWLVCGIKLGLRPSEWKYAVVEGDSLVVKNGKYHEHRACGEYRVIHLSLMTPQERGVLQDFLSELHKFPYEDAYNGCAKRLAFLLRVLRPNLKSYPSLYSLRHQFAADAKRYRSAIETAALLGHRSIATAHEYYGKPGDSEAMPPVLPDAKTMEMVTTLKYSDPKTFGTTQKVVDNLKEDGVDRK